MKRIITVATAAASALLVMAALGAGTASAGSAGTVICDTGANPCPYSAVKPAGNYIVTGDAAGYPGLQVTAGGGIEFECDYNTMTAESKAKIGNPLGANFDGTLSGCMQQKKVSCTGSMNKPPTTLEATATARYMKIGTAAEPLALTFVCPTESPSPYTCTYKLKDTLTLNLAEEEIKALFRPMYLAAGSSSACSPSSPNLQVRNFDFGSDFISRYIPTGTVICKVNEEPCAEGNSYGAGTTLTTTLSSKSSFKNNIASTECSSSDLIGQLTGSGGVEQSVPFEITSAKMGSCTNSFVFTIEGLPWHGTISGAEGSGKGVLHLTDVKMKEVRFLVPCYYGGAVDAQISGKEYVITGAKLKALPGSSELCGDMTWSATYSIYEPSPFYLIWF